MKKVLALGMAIVLLLLGSAETVFTSASTNGKTQNDAIEWCEAQLGKALDWDGAYGAQCVDFIRYYYDFLGQTSSGYAKDYRTANCPSGWTRISVSSNTALKAGDIAVYNINIPNVTGENGHVAVVAADVSAGDSTMTVYQQNSNNRMYVTKDSNISKTVLHSVIRPDFQPHVHSYDTYVYFWKSHPHYKCYACSCGEVKENRNEPTFVDYCEECQLEAQEALFSRSSLISFDAAGGQLPTYSTSNTINGYNEARGAEKLIIYNNQGSIVDSNVYGSEVAVDADGCVIAIRGYGVTEKLTVPNGGFVVSNHSYTNWWISDQAPMGSYIAYNVSAKMVYVYNTKEAYETENKRLVLGEKYGVLPTPEYAGYTFDGWYTDPVDGTLVTADSIFNGTSKLYAHWAPNGDNSSDDTDERIGDVNRDGSIDMKDVLLLRKYIAGQVKSLG